MTLPHFVNEPDAKLKEQAAPASAPAAQENALLDRCHLSLQTYGNPALEAEVLALFVKQLRGILSALAEEDADTVLLAHTLLGSARGVGAFALANAALAVERRAIAGRRDLDLIARLRQVAEQTLGEIAAA